MNELRVNENRFSANELASQFLEIGEAFADLNIAALACAGIVQRMAARDGYIHLRPMFDADLVMSAFTSNLDLLKSQKEFLPQLFQDLNQQEMPVGFSTLCSVTPPPREYSLPPGSLIRFRARLSHIARVLTEKTHDVELAGKQYIGVPSKYTSPIDDIHDSLQFLQIHYPESNRIRDLRTWIDGAVPWSDTRPTSLIREYRQSIRLWKDIAKRSFIATPYKTRDQLVSRVEDFAAAAALANSQRPQKSKLIMTYAPLVLPSIDNELTELTNLVPHNCLLSLDYFIVLRTILRDSSNHSKLASAHAHELGRGAQSLHALFSRLAEGIRDIESRERRYWRDSNRLKPLVQAVEAELREFAIVGGKSLVSTEVLSRIDHLRLRNLLQSNNVLSFGRPSHISSGRPDISLYLERILRRLRSVQLPSLRSVMTISRITNTKKWGARDYVSGLPRNLTLLVAETHAQGMPQSRRHRRVETSRELFDAIKRDGNNELIFSHELIGDFPLLRIYMETVSGKVRSLGIGWGHASTEREVFNCLHEFLSVKLRAEHLELRVFAEGVWLEASLEPADTESGVGTLYDELEKEFMEMSRKATGRKAVHHGLARNAIDALLRRTVVPFELFEIANSRCRATADTSAESPQGLTISLTFGKSHYFLADLLHVARLIAKTSMINAGVTFFAQALTVIARCLAEPDKRNG